ncbi:hypothetical protein A1Q1_04669 [Trichosporon asahii var. asahii CBS 2479]|uniref:Uncharacterized protein n=1 Tax=Trichosporon asahii var. asahii (strain ATCC 90039 / CBS 2479 / JCM 2466 / KCTC 7840 / NBRC 103889/ NCYC 2677 / UAMH 7654) TaxID=1186058 RepID=J6EQF0_TRIAS|nr:hypothetical protein A1Q1_04669 [Trichosporon asahii var. asahii CBS 2479]EJT46704.1 hypothetical protein A1Q1_04669 [Trichosporon asahii var. asahii CBS 2479]
MSLSSASQRFKDLQDLMGSPSLEVFRLFCHHTKQPSPFQDAVCDAVGGDLEGVGITPLEENEVPQACVLYRHFREQNASSRPDYDSWQGRRQGWLIMASVIDKLTAYIGGGIDERGVWGLAVAALDVDSYDWYEVEKAWDEFEEFDVQAMACVVRWSFGLGMLEPIYDPSRGVSFRVANQLPHEDARWESSGHPSSICRMMGEWLSVPWNLNDLKNGEGVLPFVPGYDTSIDGHLALQRYLDEECLKTAVRDTAEAMSITPDEGCRLARLSPWFFQFHSPIGTPAEEKIRDDGYEFVSRVINHVKESTGRIFGPTSYVWDRVVQTLDPAESALGTGVHGSAPEEVYSALEM